MHIYYLLLAVICWVIVRFLESGSRDVKKRSRSVLRCASSLKLLSKWSLKTSKPRKSDSLLAQGGASTVDVTELSSEFSDRSGLRCGIMRSGEEKNFALCTVVVGSNCLSFRQKLPFHNSFNILPNRNDNLFEDLILTLECPANTT